MGYMPTYTQHSAAMAEDAHCQAGCDVSPFFISQILSSSVFGSMHRTGTLAAGLEDLEFRKAAEILMRKRADERLEAEIEFMKSFQMKNIRAQIEQSRESSRLRRQENEFTLFCDNIWVPLFRVNPDTVLKAKDEMSVEKGRVVDMRLMIARTGMTELKGDGFDKRKNYEYFCRSFVRRFSLQSVFDTKWTAVSAATSRGMVSDSLNAHYLMQGIPSVMLFPELREDVFELEAAAWGFLHGHGNMFMKSMFSSSRSSDPDKMKRIAYEAMFGFSMLISDAYRKFIWQAEPQKTADVLAEISDSEVREAVADGYSKLLER